jgi:hypothetical protein
VKRNRSLSLFEEPDVYTLDTSAWLNIGLRSDSDDTWQYIKDLAERGCIVACAQVIDELRPSDIYALYVKPLEKALRVGDRNDADYLKHVGLITFEHPGMSKARGRKTRADPYIVALAELEGYIVVSDESRTRANRKIPGVCSKRGVRCMSLDEFIANSQKKDSTL